jgi:hypothetical protein
MRSHVQTPERERIGRKRSVAVPAVRNQTKFAISAFEAIQEMPPGEHSATKLAERFTDE